MTSTNIHRESFDNRLADDTSVPTVQKMPRLESIAWTSAALGLRRDTMVSDHRGWKQLKDVSPVRVNLAAFRFACTMVASEVDVENILQRCRASLMSILL